MICCRNGCKSGLPGLYEPVILLWAEGYPPLHQPASVAMHGTVVCAQCRETAKPIDFLPESVWKRIKIAFFESKKSQPSLKTAQITFVLPESLKLGGVKI